MKKWKAIISAFALAMCASVTAVGLGGWVIQGNGDAQYGKYYDQNAEKVAYIKEGETKTYFTSIEKAIDVANGKAASNPTIFVIPGIHYTLKNSGTSLKTVTINSGVTLSLPFQDELLFEVWKVDANGKFSVASDAKHATNTTEALLSPETYRTTQITVGKNVKIENKGTINVGGISGSAGGGNCPAGQTCNKFTEIVLEGLNNAANYQLVNYGTINNRGRIIGSDRSVLGLENKAGSRLVSNFVVRENKGGSALVGLGGGLVNGVLNNLSFKVSPFNRVYMPNTMVKTKTNGGAIVEGIANMYGNDSNNECNIPILSSSTKKDDKPLFYVASPSYLLSEVYVDSLKDKTGGQLIDKYEKMKLDFYGSASMNYMSMSLTVPTFGTRSIKTDTVLFPISYYHEVTVNRIGNTACTFSSSQDLKILPGGSITVGEGVTFSIGQIAVYDAFTDNIGWGNHKYPDNLKPGMMLIRGSFNAQTAGGYLECGGQGASLNIEKNASIVCKEVRGTPGTSVSDSDYDKLTFVASGIVSVDGNAPSKQNLVSGIRYAGTVMNETSCWTKLTVSISDSSGGTSTTLKSGGSVAIKISLLPNDSFFDTASIKWGVKESRPAHSQTYEYVNGKFGDFRFVVKETPKSGLTTWTYTITLNVKDTAGNAVACNSYKIEVKK